MSKQNDSTHKLTLSSKTVVTSTPIKGTPQPMEIDIESVTESLTQSTDGDFELTQSCTRRIPNVGKDWVYFKPMRISSLYYTILNASDSIDDISHRWLNFWEAHPKEATVYILQFFLDVAGYQNYQISKMYGTKDFNKKSLLQEFRNNCPLVLQDYTYLLRTNSDWSRSFKMSIYQFLQDTVLLSDKRTTYNYSMLNDIFQFVEFMAHSEIRALKHTAVVFAMKFLLVLSQLYGEQCNRKKSSTLMKFMKNLCINITENCGYHDSEMEEMRHECLVGFSKMLYYTFEFYTEMLEIFKKCLKNPSTKTRLATIQIIKRIVTNSDFFPHLQGKSANIFRTVIDHRCDVNFNVAVESLNIFTESVKLYKKEIPFDILNSIYSMVYNRFYPLGSAAGKFLYAMISDTCEGEILRIKKILKFSQLPAMKHLSPLLVESLIDCAPELRSYDVILDLLLLGEELSQDKIKLLEILCHTIIQTVTGKSTILRDNYRKGIIDYKQIEFVFKMMVSKFEALFNKYGKEKVCVKSLLLMLLSFSYNDKFTNKYESIILNCLECLSKYFFETNESEILDMISELFSKACLVYGVDILEATHKRCLDAYEIIVKNKDSWNEDDVEAVLLQLQSLFKYHKTSVNWDINVIQKMFPKITHVNERLLSYNISCSYEYERSVFRRSLATILSNENQQRENLDNLRTKYDKFLAECYDYLHDGTSNIIMEKVFECLCDFYTEVADQVYKNNKIFPNVMILKANLDPDHKYLLLEFLHEHVFNTAVPESVGLKYFRKFSQCIMKRGLPLCLLPNVFVYYNEFYTKYGTLFDQILRNICLIDINTVSAIVSRTLINKFEDARNKDTCDDDNQQHIDVKKLALLFVESLSTSIQVAVLRFAINFAFAREDNLIFLLCLESFCNTIPPHSKSHISDVIKAQEIYNKVQQDKHVQQFIEFLSTSKRKRMEKAKAEPKPTKKTRSISTSSYESLITDTICEEETVTDATVRQEIGDSD